MLYGQWLLVLIVALSFYGTGQIWLVQVSSYRLWAYVGQREFDSYHNAWWRSIWVVVLVPAGLLFFASIAAFWIRPPRVPLCALWLGLALQVFLLAGTAFWWGPLMARLADPNTGLILPRYRRLMATHWIRVILVTSYSALALWMLAESIT